MKTEVDGIVFDSKHEAHRYVELLNEQKHGRIERLRHQVSYAITYQDEPICVYVADFVYYRDGQRVVEDAKGHRTEVYRIKKKLMKVILGIEILET